MVDPILSKVPAKPPDSAAEQEALGPTKSGESKFDKVRVRLQDQQAESVQIPPEVKQVSPEQKKLLQDDLSKRLENKGNTSAHEVFAVDLKHAKAGLEHLTSRVNALPQTPAFEPFRQRLASIDAQYQATGQLLNTVKGTQNPGELMKIQMQMYQMTENLELMSKVVEQVTSGVKSVLQTQV